MSLRFGRPVSEFTESETLEPYANIFNTLFGEQTPYRLVFLPKSKGLPHERHVARENGNISSPASLKFTVRYVRGGGRHSANPSDLATFREKDFKKFHGRR